MSHENDSACVLVGTNEARVIRFARLSTGPPSTTRIRIRHWRRAIRRVSPDDCSDTSELVRSASPSTPDPRKRGYSHSDDGSAPKVTLDTSSRLSYCHNDESLLRRLVCQRKSVSLFYQTNVALAVSVN